jgi:predicted small metal-binding protein
MPERKSIDCRDYPSESGCTLRLEGSEDEVLDAAVNHAITRHGHTDNPELREQIRSLLKNAESRAAGT